jgi:hypothetical protein
MDIDENELQIVNKGHQRLNKHSKIWARNAFDAWHEFRGFDTTKSIAGLSKDLNSIMFWLTCLQCLFYKWQKRIEIYIL